MEQALRRMYRFQPGRGNGKPWAWGKGERGDGSAWTRRTRPGISVQAALTDPREAREVRAEWARRPTLGGWSAGRGGPEERPQRPAAVPVVPTADLASARALNGTGADLGLDFEGGPRRPEDFGPPPPAEEPPTDEKPASPADQESTDDKSS